MEEWVVAESAYLTRRGEIVSASIRPGELGSGGTNLKWMN